MTISSAGFLPYHVPFLSIENNLGKIELLTIVFGLFSHTVEAEEKSLGGGRVAASFAGRQVVSSAFNKGKKFFLSIEEVPILLLLHH